MQAIGVTAYGGPSALHLVALPDPHPGPGHIRIRVEAAGVNPVDAMVRDGSLAGWFGDVSPPYVPGMDVVGIVDELGSDLDLSDSPTLGARVVAVVDNFGAYGGYSQYVVVPVDSVIALPLRASVPEAASFLMNAMTARCGLDALPAADGEDTVLVTGAAGAVGAFVVALAAHEGRRVIALAAEGDEAFLTGLGAAAVLHDATALPKGIDAVVDPAGIVSGFVDVVRDGGTVVVVQPAIPRFDRGITVTHISVRDRITDHAALVELGRLVEAGILPLRVAAVFSATDAVIAHEMLAKRGTRGRFVLDFTAPGFIEKETS